MIIGISGAQSVGKTTLLNALRSEKCFKDFTIRNELTRNIRKLGLNINEDGNDITQEIIMKEHIYNAIMFDNMITDRIALDGVVYTQWLYDNGKVTESCLKEAQKIFTRIIDSYDYIFYIKPEFPIENDGVRSTDVQWQNDIVKLFDYYINTYKVKTIPIQGSVRERVNIILQTIGVI